MNPISLPKSVSTGVGLAIETAGKVRAVVKHELAVIIDHLPGAHNDSPPAALRLKEQSAAADTAPIDLTESAKLEKKVRPGRLSINDAVVACLEALDGPVSANAVRTELELAGREEEISHIETALASLARQGKVIHHKPVLWESLR